LLLLGTGACSFVVSTDELQAGDKGLGCTSAQKVCPDPEAPGRDLCASTTNPAFGCAANSCDACALPNAVPHCDQRDGTCAIAACSGNYADCNNTTDDGCEVDLSRDEQNCGSCSNACVAKNGATSCSSGSCVIVFCNPPYADCDKKYGNGCETNTDESAMNCGACGVPCAGTCVSGVCQATP
jgi:hypothetical protein